MNLEQIYEKCSKMVAGESEQFKLDEEPEKYALATIVARLALTKKGLPPVSLWRSGTTVHAHCSEI